MLTPIQRTPARPAEGLDPAEPSPRAIPNTRLSSAHQLGSQGMHSTEGSPPARSRARLAKFFSYYRPHIGLLLADLGCAVIVSMTALFLPVCANYVTKRLGTLGDAPNALVPFYVVGGVMLALLAAQAASTLFVDYQGHMMGAKMESALRKELFEHCQRLSFSFYDRHRVGQLMSRITNDLFALAELYHHGPEDLAIAVLKFVGVIALLAQLDITLTLMLLAVTPFALAYALHYNRRMGRAQLESKEGIATINERVEDALGGIRVVQSFANEELENQRFEADNRRFLESRRAGYRSEAFFAMGTGAFAPLLTILIIVAGAIRVAEARLTVADMLTFLLCVAVLEDPVKRLTNLARLWQQGFTGFTRVLEILEIEADVQDRPGAVSLGQRPRGALTFERVSFRYEEDGAQVLRDLSLDIEPGEFVALVGRSGVGKSSLCSLIPRFYEVAEGRILVDGVDVRDLTLGSLRRNIGVVQQDVYIFSSTVAENLRYGRPDATFEELVAAAKSANAHDFIMALPRGYDTDIGQRGVRLSGGQRQRLTIARAFLKNPPILIFDEATSALDNESERAVQQALVKLARDRTTLVIAHRLSTVRNADRILLLTEQGITEQGTHEALLAAGGVYASLYTVQASL